VICGLDVEPKVDFHRNKNTTMKKIQLAIMAGALVIAVQARATLTTFDFTYSGDSGGNAGLGTLTAQANGNGSYTILSGSFDLTAGAFAGANGTFVQNPNGPVAGSWDQRVYGGTVFGGMDNQLYPSGPAYFDLGGPLFNDPNYGPITAIINGNSVVGYGLAFNLYYDGSSYDLLVNGFGNTPWANNYSGGAVTLTRVPVPEASTMVAGALMLLPFGVSTLRIMRRKVMV
jgi:hypothetical protein